MIIQNKLKRFSVIPRDIITDNSISDRARFVFVWMASMPSDWEFYLDKMSKELGYSVETTRKYLNELCVSGWIVKGEQTVKSNGQWGAVAYTINEAKMPSTEITVTEKTRHGENPAHTKEEDILNTESILNTNSKKKESVEKDLEFADADMRDIFLEFLAYRRKIGKTLKPVSYKKTYAQLVELSNGDSILARMIVDQTIANGWQGLFKLKQQPTNTNERTNQNLRVHITRRDPNTPEHDDLPF